MSLVKEYDLLMQSAADLRHAAKELDDKASRLEQKAEMLGGLECHTRDPGFPCWICAQSFGARYHNTPREALLAQDIAIAELLETERSDD